MRPHLEQSRPHPIPSNACRIPSDACRIPLPTRAGSLCPDALTEATVAREWGELSAYFCGMWNVFAADLMNEPHMGYWGSAGWDDHPELHTSDWGLGAARMGNAVLMNCPRLLILVEGTAEYNSEWGQSFKGVWRAAVICVVRRRPGQMGSGGLRLGSQHTASPAAGIPEHAGLRDRFGPLTAVGQIPRTWDPTASRQIPRTWDPTASRQIPPTWDPTASRQIPPTWDPTAVRQIRSG